MKIDMIKEELMIGDWVLMKDKPYKVASLPSIGNPELESDKYIFHCLKDEIVPISLTPEILEKNFSSTTDWYFIGTDKFCFRIDKYKDKWDLYFGKDGKGTNLQIKISYVHELQHALRLCGIDKTIEV